LLRGHFSGLGGGGKGLGGVVGARCRPPNTVARVAYSDLPPLCSSPLLVRAGAHHPRLCPDTNWAPSANPPNNHPWTRAKRPTAQAGGGFFSADHYRDDAPRPPGRRDEAGRRTRPEIPRDEVWTTATSCAMARGSTRGHRDPARLRRLSSCSPGRSHHVPGLKLLSPRTRRCANGGLRESRSIRFRKRPGRQRDGRGAAARLTQEWTLARDMRIGCWFHMARPMGSGLNSRDRFLRWGSRR